MALHSTLDRDVLEALPERIHSTTAEAYEMDQGEETVKKGDLVLVIDENSPRKQWPMALIVETREGRDGLVRSVKLRSKGTCITCPVTKIVPLECD